MKVLITILLLINLSFSDLQNDDNVDIEKMFPNMPLIEEYHDNKERDNPYTI